LTNDLIVAGIVTVMLIAQSMAYALWAGLPVQVGLFACMAALVLYGLFGTSRTLAVGHVAVATLMTAAAVSPLTAQGMPEYLGAAGGAETGAVAGRRSGRRSGRTTP
jgi:SulP family sulfate permease